MRFILTRALIVAAAVVLPTIVALIVTANTKSNFEATTKILIDQPSLVLTPQGAINPVGKIVQLIPTYVEIIQSYPTAEAVSKSLSNISTDEVKSSLTASKIEDTQVLKIQVNNSNASKAKQIASKTADVFIDKVSKDQENVKVNPENRLELSIIEPAFVTEKAPAVTRTAGLAAVMGLVISISGIAIYENAKRS